MSEGAIRAWRLSKARYAGDLTGQGAARDGQRWNPPGQRATYLGMTPEITLLAALLLCGYDVPKTAGLIGEAHGQASAAFGGDWLRTGKQLGLVVPSVVVPQARNLLLNPLHTAMAQVALVPQEPFQLDRRLG